MAESGEETERKITVTVKTPKEKQEIEVEGDATVKEVISEIFDCMFIQFLQDYFLNVTDVFRKCTTISCTLSFLCVCVSTTNCRIFTLVFTVCSVR